MPTAKNLLREYLTTQLLQIYRQRTLDWRQGSYDLVIITENIETTLENSLQLAKKLRGIADVPATPIAFSSRKPFSQEEQTKYPEIDLWLPYFIGSDTTIWAVMRDENSQMLLKAREGHLEV